MHITVVEAKTWKQKILGLLFYKHPINLFFKTRFGIHTFGLRFPIDIVIFDKNNHVVAIKENLRPNRIFLWNPAYSNVLELTKGTIKNLKIHEGTKLDIKLSLRA